ncbi:MAG: cupin domain-containing protein [Anaerolineales bacterium]
MTPQPFGEMRRRRRQGWKQVAVPSSKLMNTWQAAVENLNANVDVGSRLREVRQAQGFSLRALAEKSGLNVNTLCLIENNKTSPSVSTLQQLALALQVPITAFFERVEEPKMVVYQKSGYRPQAQFHHGILEDLGNGITLAGGQPLLVTLESGADSGANPIVHTGQEFVYCLEGCLEYRIGEETYILEAGDSLIFEAHIPHQWGNKGEGITRSLLIICPSDEADQATERHFVYEDPLLNNIHV